ncbi:hypothetical protein N0V85_006638, partial [Neurospora sp. IMI 360204]
LARYYRDPEPYDPARPKKAKKERKRTITRASAAFSPLAALRKFGRQLQIVAQILHDSKHRGIEVGDVKLNHRALPVIDCANSLFEQQAIHCNSPRRVIPDSSAGPPLYGNLERHKITKDYIANSKGNQHELDIKTFMDEHCW